MTDKMLLLSIAICGLGPLVSIFSTKFKKIHQVILIGSLVLLASLLALELIPEIYHYFGIAGLGFVLFGFLLTTWAEGRLPNSSSSLFPWFLWTGFLTFHALMDGLSLFISASSAMDLVDHGHHGHSHFGHSLGWGIILHRCILVPLVWEHLGAFLSLFWRMIVMSLIAGLTVVGYYGGEYLYNSTAVLIAVEGIVTGGLLHINFDAIKRIHRSIRASSRSADATNS